MILFHSLLFIIIIIIIIINIIIFLSRIVEFDVNGIHILLYKRTRFAEIYWYNNNNSNNNNNNKENNNKRKYGEN